VAVVDMVTKANSVLEPSTACLPTEIHSQTVCTRRVLLACAVNTYPVYYVLSLHTLYLLCILCTYTVYYVLTLYILYLLCILCTYSVYSILTLYILYLLTWTVKCLFFKKVIFLWTLHKTLTAQLNFLYADSLNIHITLGSM